jgi:O-antigen ligase
MSAIWGQEPVTLQPDRGERAYQATLSAALATLGFFLPFSIAGALISLGVLALLCLAAPGRIWRTRFWREPVHATGMLLLAYVMLRTGLGGGGIEGMLQYLNKYQELLMVPMLWALLRNARRPQAFVNGFMLGSLVLAGLYWGGLALGSRIQWLQSHRISAGFALALGAYLLLEHARLGRVPRMAGYLAAAWAACTVLFVVDSRTGHVVLVVLLTCAAWRAAPPRARVGAGVAALLVLLLLGTMSPTVRQRVVETVQEAQASSRGELRADSSTGVRLELLQNGIAVAREHWKLGTGWHGRQQAVEQVARERHPDPRPVPGALSTNPHNEYLLQLATGGLPALLLFIAWLASPMWRSVRTRDPANPWHGALGCVALAFAIGCVFNSLLLDFIEGHVYAGLLAWLLARRAAPV